MENVGNNITRQPIHPEDFTVAPQTGCCIRAGTRPLCNYATKSSGIQNIPDPTENTKCLSNFDELFCLQPARTE